MSFFLMAAKRAGGAAPAVDPSEIAVTLNRMSSGSGSTLCATGVWLQEGQLMPADIGNVLMTVGGTEVPIYAEALRGTYSDGSARVVYVEVNGGTMTRGTPVAANLVLNGTPGESRLTVSDGATRDTWLDNGVGYDVSDADWDVAGHGTPPGLISPTSATHLAAACPWGPLIAASAVTSFTGYAGYNTAFDDTYVTTVKAWTGGIIPAANYPRSIGLLRKYAMTADVQYLETAMQWLTRMRVNYWESNAFQAMTEWQQNSDSIAALYWMLRDTAALDSFATSPTAVDGALDKVYKGTSSGRYIWMTGTDEGGRNIALGLRTIEWATKLDFQNVSGFTDIQNAAELWLDRLTNSPNWNGNAWEVFKGGQTIVRFFFQAILCDAIIGLCDTLPASATKTAALARCDTVLDWMKTQTTTSSGGTTTFTYDDITNSDGGTMPDPSVDLNGFFAHLYAWRATRSADVTDANLARTFIASAGLTPRDGDTGPYLTGQKQWDESFAWSAKTFAYLAQAGI